MPEASAPSTKYFIAASVEVAESRCSATIEYRLNDISSSQVQGQEVRRRDHHHHAQRGEQGQGEELPTKKLPAACIDARVNQHTGDHDVHQDLERIRHAVVHEQPVEGVDGVLAGRGDLDDGAAGERE
jgi:hypothetical protein